MEPERIIGRIELQGVNGIGKYALVSLCDLDNLSQFNWFFHNGYAIATIDGEQFLMHRMVMGLSPRQSEEYEEVDHINHNRLDNTRSNLRIVNRAQNNSNRSKNQTMNGKPTSSQFKGVYWDKENQKWKAQIRVNKKQYHLGRFDDEVQAALAYDRKSRELHGHYGNPNFPDPVVQPVINIYNYYYAQTQ